jgi:hypothetical protein
MGWLPLYLDDNDAQVLLTVLNEDPEVAFIVSEGPARWIARRTLATAPDGTYCIWHEPSGPLPLVRAMLLPSGRVKDPWSGWTEKRKGADSSVPYFGPGHPGVIWWNLRTKSRATPGGIGMSSFEWIGNHYRVIGSPAHPATESWWKRLRTVLKRLRASRIPRTGPLDGPVAEVWAMPSALSQIRAGVCRDEDPL